MPKPTKFKVLVVIFKKKLFLFNNTKIVNKNYIFSINKLDNANKKTTKKCTVYKVKTKCLFKLYLS